MSKNQPQPTFTVKAVSEATGLSPLLLRAWERRYQAVQPDRMDNGRRAYTADDVARLQLLAQLVKSGHAISRVAALDDAALQALVEAGQDSAQSAPPYPRLHRNLLETISHLDAEGCDHVLRQAVATLDMRDLVNNLLMPALKEVGDRWGRGEFNVAHERVLTASLLKLLLALLNWRRQTTRPAVVFAGLSGERHEFGILCAALLAADHRLDCRYLGPDLPAIDTARISRACGAHAVAITAVRSDPASLRTHLSELQALAKALDPVPVFVGGHGAELLDTTELPVNCRVVTEFSHFEEQMALIGQRGISN